MSALPKPLPDRLKVHVASSARLMPEALAGEFELVADPLAAAVVVDGPDARPIGRPLVSLGGNAGAGRLPADATIDQVVAAVRAVSVGLVVRGPSDAGGLAPLADLPAGELLTPRELDVLQALTRGASNKEIARQLGLSLHTVKFYVEAVFRKLDAHSRAEAVAKGLVRLIAGRTEM